MKAHITPNGVLVVTSENATEAFALQQWNKLSRLKVNDVPNMETTHVKGSHIKTIAEVPNENAHPRP